MKFKDLQSLIAPDHPVVVEFGPKIEDVESYAEPGMRAELTRFRLDSDPSVCIVSVNFAPFDEFNKAFESAAYYDKSGVPCLTARESGHYQPSEDLFFMTEDDLAGCLSVLDTSRTTLLAEYRSSDMAKAGHSYVQWLEAQLLALRA